MNRTQQQRQALRARFKRERFEAWGEEVEVSAPKAVQAKPFPKLMPASESGCIAGRDYSTPHTHKPQPVSYAKPTRRGHSYATRQHRPTAWPMRCRSGKQLAGRRYYETKQQVRTVTTCDRLVGYGWTW